MNHLKQLETLLDACTYLTWIKDEEGRLVYINQIYADRVRKNKEDIIGKKEEEVWGAALEIGWVDYLNEDVYFEIYETDLYEGAKVVGRKGIAQDITADKRIIKQFERVYNKIADRLPSVDRLPNNEEHKDMVDKFHDIGEGLLSDVKADAILVVTKEESYKASIWYSKGFSKEEKNQLNTFIHEPDIYKPRGKKAELKSLRMVEELEHEEHKLLLKQKGIKYILRYPIIFDGKIIGAIIVYNPKKVPDFNTSHIAHYMGMIIKNFLLSRHVLRKIKERVETEQELKVFFEASYQMMITLDECRNVKIIGDKVYEILGWDYEEVCTYIKNEYKLEMYIEKARNSKQEEVVKVEHHCPCKDGTYKFIEWVITYKEEDNMIVIVGEDITKHKKKEEEYLRLQVEMDFEYIKGEFLACMSNEFKTPVNTILYTIELLQDMLNSKQMSKSEQINLTRYIELIRQNAYRLIRLINNLVDTNSIEAGAYKLNLGNYNIVQIVRDIVHSVAEYIETKGIHLSFETVVDELVISCDPDKIERIMLNLISNAIKYTEVGGQIEIKLSYEKTYMSISVKDNGEGIHKSKLESIFDRFVQCEEGLTRKREGSGIGLSLVKSLVKLHKGEITVESMIGCGTEFIVSLPLVKVLDEEYEKESEYKIDNRAEVWNIEFADIYK